MKAKDLIQSLMTATLTNYHNITPPMPKTCDGQLCGDPEKEIHKVATTFIVTVAVLRKAIEQGVDMIISHEPIFCLPVGEATMFRLEDNAVTEEKRRLIEESGIVIMRFHDGMHFVRPDLIYRGWMEEFGWKEYNIPGPNNHFYELPETTMGAVAQTMKEHLNMPGVRVFGDPATKVKRVGVLVGGGSQGLGNPMMPMNCALDEQLDLVICGEIMELMLPYWYEDAAELGHPCTLIVLGHNRTEEVGMKYLPSWLATAVPGPEYCFIESGDPLYMI